MLNLFILNGVLGVPHIVCNELLNTNFPVILEVSVINVLNLLYESFDVLDKDVVSCDQDPLLVFQILQGVLRLIHNFIFNHRSFTP
jgi:hypothetical protein